ncbi:MAG TPA: Xaa-Pro peptidase family protein [Geminicoccaceae bacterium]|nr:Xaa-Pro peptidase family protein [Geminicoccaceae bacterium]
MKELDFEPAEFADRQRRVRAAMRAAGVELLLVTSPININYLVGARSKGYQHFQCLFFPLEPGPLILLSKLAERAELTDFSLADDIRSWGGYEPEDPIAATKKILDEKGYLRKKIGLEAPRYYVSPHEYMQLREVLGAAFVHDATRLVEDLKYVKSPAELAYIRRAAAIADAGMRSFVDALAEGRTELEVAAEAHRTMMALGSDAPPSPMNVGAGERSAYAHAMPNERRLRKGDFIHNEYGASYRRYVATLGRVMCLGTPTDRMREIYQAVRDASDACIATMRPGVACVEPHRVARGVLRKAGMEQFSVHTTGYGIAPGFPPAWGESIHMFADSPYTLEAGMVLSVEPPVYIHEEKLGARMIDNVLVTETGAEILSGFTRDFIVV